MAELLTDLRPNMVAPTGKLFRSTCRGTLMGNRGPLLDNEGHLQREFAHQRWISCTLDEVHGRRVRFDDPSRYTPLFFSDEAVALAAGHRACGSCRPAAYQHFADAWRRYKGWPPNRLFRAAVMDRELHHYRTQDVSCRGLRAKVAELPNGCFIWGDNGEHLLLWNGAAVPWSHSGYGRPLPIFASKIVVTITPLPMVEVLRCRYPVDTERLLSGLRVKNEQYRNMPSSLTPRS